MSIVYYSHFKPNHATSNTPFILHYTTNHFITMCYMLCTYNNIYIVQCNWNLKREAYLDTSIPKATKNGFHESTPNMYMLNTVRLSRKPSDVTIYQVEHNV